MPPDIPRTPSVLTDQHITEALSRAYVRAISGRAGLNLAIWEFTNPALKGTGIVRTNSGNASGE